MDFRSVFPALRKGNYDAVGVYIVAAGHNAFFRQARSAGVRFSTLFGTNGFESSALNEGVEDVVEGALFSNTALAPDFRQKYLRRFGTTDQIVDAALAYEFAVLVKDLFFQRPLPESAEELLSRFALPSSRSGICGEYRYINTPESGQYFRFPVEVGEMRKGKPVILSQEG